jgi:hypothetical protein
MKENARAFISYQTNNITLFPYYKIPNTTFNDFEITTNRDSYSDLLRKMQN